MVARLLMHPLAENIFTVLSVGLILFSIGLIGSLLWGAQPSPDDVSSAPASAAAASITPVSAAIDSTFLASIQHVDFSVGPSLADRKR